MCGAMAFVVGPWAGADLFFQHDDVHARGGARVQHPAYDAVTKAITFSRSLWRRAVFFFLLAASVGGTCHRTVRLDGVGAGELYRRPEFRGAQRKQSRAGSIIGVRFCWPRHCSRVAGERR